MFTRLLGPETTIGRWRLRMAIMKLADTDGEIEFLNRVIQKGKASQNSSRELERAKKRYLRRYKTLSKLSFDERADVSH